MPSALSRSYSLPLSQNSYSGVKSSPMVDPLRNDGESTLVGNSYMGGSQKLKAAGIIDPKAVGSHLAHRPLSRRGSMAGSEANDSLALLSNHQQHSLLQYAVSASLDEVKRGHRKLERTQSEPNHRPAVANSSRYKTELCRPFEESGNCKYGDKCQFAHGLHELRSLPRHPKYKTELCKTFHTVGFCPYGPRCHFVHNAEEARTHTTSQRFKKTLPVNLFALGSTAESPSPPSSLSESPRSGSSFFSDDLLPGNPFSPAAGSGNNGFFYDSDFGSPFFGRSSGSRFSQVHSFSDLYADALNVDDLAGLPVKLPGLDSPSPAESLASDLDSLSLGSDSPPPPSTISSPMETSRGLRLPIFSRISENSTEGEDSN